MLLLSLDNLHNHKNPLLKQRDHPLLKKHIRLLHKEPSEGKLGQDLDLKLLAPNLYMLHMLRVDRLGQLVLVLNSISSDALAFASDDG